jgi:hypothetical protein
MFGGGIFKAEQISGCFHTCIHRKAAGALFRPARRLIGPLRRASHVTIHDEHFAVDEKVVVVFLAGDFFHQRAVKLEQRLDWFQLSTVRRSYVLQRLAGHGAVDLLRAVNHWKTNSE